MAPTRPRAGAHLQAAREMMPALPVPGSSIVPRPPRDGLGLTIDDSVPRL
jgi:hypothetical protein